MAIYFIQCGDNGPIKIGQTTNSVDERMAQLQTGCPYKLRLLWVYNGGLTESDIHKALRAERIRGEWFHPSDSVFRYINETLLNEIIIETSNGRYLTFQESYSNQDYISLDYEEHIKIKNTNVCIVNTDIWFTKYALEIFPPSLNSKIILVGPQEGLPRVINE